jgi:endonuclease YncB( thermonuclease family)
MILVRVGLLILIFVCSVITAPALAQSIVDGDTLFVGRLKYRLCGIDAPERDEPGYREATTYLRKLVAGKTIKCTPVGHGTPCDGRSKPRSYDRIVAQCFVDGKDLAAEMVRAGHAKDWPRFSGGHYAR